MELSAHLKPVWEENLITWFDIQISKSSCMCFFVYTRSRTQTCLACSWTVSWASTDRDAGAPLVKKFVLEICQIWEHTKILLLRVMCLLISVTCEPAEIVPFPSCVGWDVPIESSSVWPHGADERKKEWQSDVAPLKLLSSLHWLYHVRVDSYLCPANQPLIPPPPEPAGVLLGSWGHFYLLSVPLTAALRKKGASLG